MKFVATKSVDQLDLQALHRVRERLVGQRTGIVNQIRAFLLERGIAVRQGPRFLRLELPRNQRGSALRMSSDKCGPLAASSICCC
jgi:transposase